MKTLMFALLFSSFANAFTLNNNFGAAFKKKDVKVHVAADTACTQGITAGELAALVKPAVNNFWNKVPTSSLRLKADGFSSPIGTDINTDRLCAPTNDTCLNSGQPLIPPVSGIVIACNRNNDNFDGAANVLAVTVPNNFSGRKIVGAVILINDISSAFKDLSKDDKIAVLAHEIGHAIGLGHAEERDKAALMYYKTVNLRKGLGQDDIDGVSYLYPVKMDGCGLLATIDTNNIDLKGPPFWQMGLSLFMMILLFELGKLLRRPKRSAPA